MLDHTEAYRFAVAPPPGRRWPPVKDWNERVRDAASAWREAAGSWSAPPQAVREAWHVVTNGRCVPLSAVRDGSAWSMCTALLTLHAMADEACAGLAAAGAEVAERPFERRAWAQLAETGSLSCVSPTRVRVTPKSHFAARGVMIRSLSRYLALCYEAVDVQWQRTEAAARWPGIEGMRRDFNIVLVPWPLHVCAEDFRPVEGPLDNMDRSSFGFFEFAPRCELPIGRLPGLLDAAHRIVRRIDLVILPEAAADESEVGPLEDVLAAHRVRSLIAGVRTQASVGFAENRVHIGIREQRGWRHLEQAKHHRWCLDEAQIRQYHLGKVLDRTRLWWEAIELPERQVQVLDMGGGATAAPLICEDLARMDEVADVLRRIGPSLVIALLLDGPQLHGRWPFRYASVLADDPGSAVLTLTSLGMVLRSQPPGMTRSRVVALWNDATHGVRELSLARGASAILITASVGAKTVWTADGRCHLRNTPELVLTEVHQLAARERRPAAELVSVSPPSSGR